MAERLCLSEELRHTNSEATPRKVRHSLKNLKPDNGKPKACRRVLRQSRFQLGSRPIFAAKPHPKSGGQIRLHVWFIVMACGAPGTLVMRRMSDDYPFDPVLPVHYHFQTRQP